MQKDVSIRNWYMGAPFSTELLPHDKPLERHVAYSRLPQRGVGRHSPGDAGTQLANWYRVPIAIGPTRGGGGMYRGGVFSHIFFENLVLYTHPRPVGGGLYAWEGKRPVGNLGSR